MPHAQGKQTLAPEDLGTLTEKVITSPTAALLPVRARAAALPLAPWCTQSTPVPVPVPAAACPRHVCAPHPRRGASDTTSTGVYAGRGALRVLGECVCVVIHWRYYY